MLFLFDENKRLVVSFKSNAAGLQKGVLSSVKDRVTVLMHYFRQCHVFVFPQLSIQSSGTIAAMRVLRGYDADMSEEISVEVCHGMLATSWPSSVAYSGS